MTHAEQETTEKVYLTGTLLSDSPFEFGDSELLKAYGSLSGSPNPTTKSLNAPAGILEGILKLTESLQHSHLARSNQNQLLSKLRSDILTKIQKSELQAFGYSAPRNIADKPIRIPADLFVSGEMHWENSELKFKNLEFTGVRIVTEQKAQSAEIAPIKENKFSKYENSNFMINENEASEFLGISRRTLQGYRVKGGGPEFHKFGKAVKYKMSDLNNWRDGKRKQNTSQI